MHLTLSFVHHLKAGPFAELRHKSDARLSFKHLIQTYEYSCAITQLFQVLTFRIHMISHEMPKEQRFFNCAKPIEALNCLQCAKFETHSFTHLKRHVKAGHTFLELVEKSHECVNCNFQTHSNYLLLRHKLVSLCMRNKHIKSEAIELAKEFQLTNENDAERDIFQWFECAQRSHETKAISTLKPQGNKESLKCVHCSFETKYRSSLKAHILSKHTDLEKLQWFQCAQCPYKTKTKSEVKRHMDRMHGHQKFKKCDHCPFTTKFKQSLQNHFLYKHTELEKIPWFECGQCWYKTKLKSDLKSHMDNKHGNKKYIKCGNCPFKTKYGSSLRSHMLAKHTELEMVQWFKCAQCSYKTKTKAEIKRHLDRIHDDKTYLKCDHCPFQTKYKHSLRDHILCRHTDVKKIPWFECAQCSCNFKTKTGLRRHVERIHSNRKCLKCDQCAFATKYELTMKNHVSSKHTVVQR